MKQIDLGPDDYQKQDPATGRWLQNVDRRLCALGSVAALGIATLLAWAAVRDGATLGVIVGPAVGAFLAGGLLVLSLRRTDW